MLTTNHIDIISVSLLFPCCELLAVVINYLWGLLSRTCQKVTDTCRSTPAQNDESARDRTSYLSMETQTHSSKHNVRNRIYSSEYYSTDDDTDDENVDSGTEELMTIKRVNTNKRTNGVEAVLGFVQKELLTKAPSFLKDRLPSLVQDDDNDEIEEDIYYIE